MVSVRPETLITHVLGTWSEGMRVIVNKQYTWATNLTPTGSLPDPVRPTMPIFSLGLMVKDTFFRTRGRFSWYLISAFSKVTSPSWGQSGGGALFLILAGASKERVWGDRSGQVRLAQIPGVLS